MAQSLSRVYLHIVFSTKNRLPFLADPDLRNEMHAYMGGTCNQLGCPVIRIGGTADHVHILCMVSRVETIAKLVEEVKKSSSKWVKTKGQELQKFAWQNGYGVFSISQSHVDVVKRYIETQEEHHRKRTFQDEYRTVLKEYEVSYDERYVWD
jgi:REP element-mobilizing transposase RayT